MKKHCLILLFIPLLLQFLSVNCMAQQVTLEKIWETDTIFSKPESVVFDSSRQRLYVSNYNRLPKKGDATDDFISIMNLDGEVINMKWITGLRAPTGLLIQNDSLLVVERDGVGIYHIHDGRLLHKYHIPDKGFLNDITTDGQGTFYVTNTSFKNPSESSIEKLVENTVETMAIDAINRPNGILYEDDQLIFGNSGDASLKKVDLTTQEVQTLVQFEKGVIDGIKRYDDNNLLVSLWQGKLFMIHETGVVTELLNTRPFKVKIADFEFIPSLNMIVFPTYPGKKMLAYIISK